MFYNIGNSFPLLEKGREGGSAHAYSHFQAISGIKIGGLNEDLVVCLQ